MLVRPLLLLVLAAAPLLAQEARTTWRRPPEPVAKMVLAPSSPTASLDPTGSTLLLLEREPRPPLADLARPMLRLAGLRLDAARNAPHGPRRWRGLSFLRLDDTSEKKVTLPEGAAPDRFAWSADGERVAFTCTREAGVELWLADAATGQARALTGPTLNAAGEAPFTWLPDGRLLVRFVPAGRGPAPERAPVPPGPVASETQGRATPVRTLTDLLTDEHDMLLFEHHLRCQLAIVDLAGKRTDVGAPDLWTSVQPSPDGQWLLTGRTERPYSLLVGWDAFPERVEVRGLDGAVVREVAKHGLRDDIPIQGVERGPRGVEWQASGRPGEPALLVWSEAQDEGDPKKKVPHRDRLMTLAAPFAGAPAELLKLEHRYMGLTWLERAATEATSRALVSEYDRDTRWSRTWLLTLEKGALAGEPRKLWDRSTKDVYGHPGSPLSTSTPQGERVARVRGNALLLGGRGASPEGDLPFLDRLDLATFATTRLWRCEPGHHEEVTEVLDDAATRLLTRHETPDEPANYRVRTLGAKAGEGGAIAPITSFADPTPELRGVKKQLLTYARNDGVKLSGTLYTPAGWTPEQGKLPLLLWAYPQEFNDAGTAGQVSGSPWRFTRFAGPSHLFLVTQGYAVLDDATMPVIGDPETVNDTFVEQIVAAAKAAIDRCAELGVADPARVAVAGHSYGAFMTANLLAHCDLFKAGVARSGAYNRTLTPFGFQGERRTLWQARETYALLSPFTWADKIKTPLLMIHGQLDPNPGTFPMQSERLFHAIQGHGGTARLVVLPYEGHGYVARESVLHVLAEMIDWLDRHVKRGKAD